MRTDDDPKFRFTNIGNAALKAWLVTLRTISTVSKQNKRRIMDFLTSNNRSFQGDEQANVTDFMKIISTN